MNWADYVIVIILALSVLMGLLRGLISEVMALAIWIVAFWAAWAFGPRVAAAFRGSIDEPSIRIILGFALCFVVVLIVGALLRFVINKLVEGTGLSGSDRMLGMLFGLARGVLLVTLLVFLLGFTPFTRDPWWHQSRLLPTFISTADWLGQYVPDNVRHYLHTHTPSRPYISPGPPTSPSQPLSTMSSTATGLSAGKRPVTVSSTGFTRPAGLAPEAHSRDN